MKTRRFLAWFVAALLLLTSFALPTPLSVTREAEAATEAAEEKYYTDSGICGPNLKWSFDSRTGALVITGSGDMYNYTAGNSIWYNNNMNADILSVSLPKGLTSIGDYAFYKCYGLQSIDIPSKVKSIGESAFEECSDLMVVNLPKSVTKIGDWAFYDCQYLDAVNYAGKAEDRLKILISKGNSALLFANWTYKKANTANLQIKTQPKNVTVDEGQVATFSVKTAGATLVQWEYLKTGLDPSDNDNWDLVGVNSATCSVLTTADMDGYMYRCWVANDDWGYYSDAATLTVRIPKKLKIKTQPKKISAKDGQSVTFSVSAVGASYYYWQYQWNFEDPKYDAWRDYSKYGDNTKSSITLRADGFWAGARFRCIVSNDRGEEVASKPAQLTMKVAIKSQPKSVTAYKGGSATFRVQATGAYLYYWQFQVPGYKYWFDMEDFPDIYKYTDATDPDDLYAYDNITFTGIEDGFDGISIRCVVYNDLGKKASSAAKLTVKSQPQSVVGARRALLIGENNYWNISSLGGCINDMEAMRGMLQGLKESFSTKCLSDASRSEILNAISSTFAGTNSSSVSLFYYSGHGADDLGGAICPINTTSTGGNLISFAELAEALNDATSGKVIVILDSCFSGSAIEVKGKSGNMSKAAMQAYNQAAIDAFSGYKLEGSSEKMGELATPKFTVITACEYDNTSLDGYFDGSEVRQGEFTAALIQGMGCTYSSGAYTGSMPADDNVDGLITLGELYGYTFDTAVHWYEHQYAQCYGDLDYILFRRK